MSTGIISVGLHDFGWLWASQVLLWLAVLCGLVLAVLYVWRAVSHRDAVARDLRDPRKTFGFFTIVAGVGIVEVPTTTRIGRLDAFPPAETIGGVVLAIAVGVWMRVFAGMLVTLVMTPQRAAQP